MTQLQGQERAEYVRTMFDRIADRYDLMNRLMTFGRDRAWRRYVIQQAALHPGDALLDVATGTGDIAFEGLTQLDGQITAVGADFAVEMMRVGQTRPQGDVVLWSGVDALNLPFPPRTFTAVTSGYLMRNVIDVERAFSEQYRVLKPGGRVICLETSPPRGVLKPFIVAYLKYGIPTLGKLVAGESSAYTYLPESTQAFRTPADLAAVMEGAGFIDVRWKTFMLGTMAVHVGVKPPYTLKPHKKAGTR